MDDAMFLAELISGGMFPGDTKGKVKAKSTRAEKSTEFLTECIEPGFSDDNCNKILEKLLTIMEQSGFEPASDLAKEFKCGCELLHITYTV